VAIDGSKFRAVSSSGKVHERKQLERYLEGMEKADAEEEVEMDKSAVAAALEQLRQHGEAEANFLRTTMGKVPAYNVQIAVDGEHALIVAQRVTGERNDRRNLQPMAEAAQAGVGKPGGVLHVVADTGYSNGEQAAACEAQKIVAHVPANRSVNNPGDGTLFDRSVFQYDQASDTLLCPAGQRLHRHQRKQHSIVYAGQREVGGACPLQSQCTVGPRRLVKRHVHEGALQRMQQRATPEAMS
jgi:transposase